MTNYCEWDDLVDRYPIAEDYGGASELSSGHIFYASRELDGMLGQHFTTPFSSDNLTAKDLTIELTYLRISRNRVENWDKHRDAVMDRVKKLRTGEENMVTTTGGLLATVGETVWSSTMDYHPTFGVDEEEYMHVDSSQVWDERNDRGQI